MSILYSKSGQRSIALCVPAFVVLCRSTASVKTLGPDPPLSTQRPHTLGVCPQIFAASDPVSCSTLTHADKQEGRIVQIIAHCSPQSSRTVSGKSSPRRGALPRMAALGACHMCMHAQALPRRRSFWVSAAAGKGFGGKTPAQKHPAKANLLPAKLFA